MFYDPYDDEVQVKFHRTDPTGRTVPLDDMDEVQIGILEIIGAFVAVSVLVGIAIWWWA